VAQDSKYGQIEIPGVPDDEPVFIIRGKDLSAPWAVRGYASHALDAGATDVFAQGCAKRADEIEKWQSENKSLVKTPD
jgi:hypothetical protein